MDKLINATIRRDIELLTGWDFLPVAEAIKEGTGVLWFTDLFPEYIIDLLKQVANNLETVYWKYFFWTEAKFKNPIDLYLNVFECWPTIIEELTEGLAKEPLDCPIGYHMRTSIEIILEKFPDSLLESGYLHKFDKNFMSETIYEDENQEEN